MQDIGTAAQHPLVVNEGFMYYGDFSKVTITNTDEFVESLKAQLLGVSKDKITVSAKPKIRQIKNAADKVKGWETIDKWDVKVTADMLDFNTNLLESSLFKKVESRYEAIQGLIPASSYKDLLIVGWDINEKPVIVHIKNTYNNEGLGFDLKGQDESGFKVEFNAAYESQKISPVSVYATFTEMAKSLG